MMRTVTLMTLALVLAPGTAWGSSAVWSTGLQQPRQQQQAPPWTREESQAFNAAIQEKDQAKKAQLLEGFVSKFPKSALTPIAKRFLVMLYAQSHNTSRAFQMAASYFSSNNEKYAEAFKLVFGPPLEKAGAKLPTKPREDFQLIYLLADAANKAARANDYTFENQGLRYTQQALALIRDGGPPPTIAPVTWSKSKNAVLGTLHQTIGLARLHNKDYEGALAALQKAGQLASTDPVTFYLQGEALRSSKYAESRKVVAETRKKYDEANNRIKAIEDQVNKINQELEALSKKPSTRQNKARIEQLQHRGQLLANEGKELSQQVQQLSDQIDQQVAETDRVVDYMIQVYAKAVALSDNLPGFQKQARQHLELYYRYRHQGKLDGLDQIIQQMKTQMPRPMSSDSPSARS